MADRPVSQCLIVVLILFGAFVGASAANDPGRRVLDVRLSTLEDSISARTVYRIQIHLSEFSRYRVEGPGPGQPLKVTLQQADVPLGLTAKPGSNALIQRMRVIPSDTGMVELAFDLESSQVKVSDYPIRSPMAVIVIDLRLFPGVLLPMEARERLRDLPDMSQRVQATATPPVASADGRAAGSTGPDGDATAVPMPRDVAKSPGTAAPGEMALPGGARAGGDGAPVVVTASTRSAPAPEAPTPEQKKYDYFPIDELRLDFDRAEELIDLYKAGEFAEALDLAIEKLHEPQPRGSLESLLFLAAECRYQLARLREAQGQRADNYVPPDWPSALNYYVQARRFAWQSDLRPIADYRIATMYYLLERLPEHVAELEDLLVRKPDAPFLNEVLRFLAQSSYELAQEMKFSSGHLDKAEKALTDFREKFPDSPRIPQVHFMLGEIAYRRRDYHEAYRLMYKAHQEALKRKTPLRVDSDMYAHFPLTAHREGKANLARPVTAEDRAFVEQTLSLSQDPSVRLEYARILDAGGKRRLAMRQYHYVLRDLEHVATPDQLFEARMALTRYALSDTLAGGIDPTIPYDAYRYPYRTLRDLYEKSYDVRQRAELLREAARHLIAQGRKLEAIRLILPHLEPGRLPKDVARELRQAIWDVMPDVMRSAQARGDYLQALQVYEAFGQYLDEHPRRNDILLDCTRILLNSGLYEQARGAVERLLNMTPYADLTPSQQKRLTSMSRELRLAPDDPDTLKRDARAILQEDVEQATKARVLKLLADTWAGEGRHAHAAELHLRGTAYDELDWRRRLEFYENAAAEYEKQGVYNKVVEVVWQAVRFLEEQGVAHTEAPERYQHLLLMLGGGFQKLNNHEQAAKAYEQYLELFPRGEDAPSARYELATCYEDQGRTKEAMAAYGRLEKEAGSDSFWGKLAAKGAGHLEWKNSRSYLRNTEEPTP